MREGVFLGGLGFLFFGRVLVLLGVLGFLGCFLGFLGLGGEGCEEGVLGGLGRGVFLGSWREGEGVASDDGYD